MDHLPLQTTIEVAAAVMFRQDGKEFLLACRPEGKVYAGYWEFPGGKVEPGESIHAALVRELQEELGITVTQATPWLTRCFTYPHAQVSLNFWQVTAWEGEIGITAPLEHSAVAWQSRSGPTTVSPILPANGPILKALALPEQMAITNASENGVDNELAALSTALERGLGLIQIREDRLEPSERERFTRAALALARPKQAIVLINGDEALARRVGAEGVHLQAHQLAACNVKPDLPWVGASCHTKMELQRAAELALDYALLSPVLPTTCHPENDGLGWAEFSRMTANSPIPVLALGGLNAKHLPAAKEHGAHGIAMLRGWRS